MVLGMSSSKVNVMSDNTRKDNGADVYLSPVEIIKRFGKTQSGDHSTGVCTILEAFLLFSWPIWS